MGQAGAGSLRFAANTISAQRSAWEKAEPSSIPTAAGKDIKFINSAEWQLKFNLLKFLKCIAQFTKIALAS